MHATCHLLLVLGHLIEMTANHINDTALENAYTPLITHNTMYGRLAIIMNTAAIGFHANNSNNNILFHTIWHFTQWAYKNNDFIHSFILH